MVEPCTTGERATPEIGSSMKPRPTESRSVVELYARKNELTAKFGTLKRYGPVEYSAQKHMSSGVETVLLQMS